MPYPALTYAISDVAGVVNMPSDLSQAYDDAIDAAAANGYGSAALIATPVGDNRLQVDLTAPVDTFFLNVFGLDRIHISRRATAQYILPVPIGNDSSCFGCPGTGFWAARRTAGGMSATTCRRSGQVSSPRIAQPGGPAWSATP